MSLALLNLVRIIRHSVGLKSVNGSVRSGIAGGFSRARSAFSSAGRSNRPNMRAAKPAVTCVAISSASFTSRQPERLMRALERLALDELHDIEVVSATSPKVKD